MSGPVPHTHYVRNNLICGKSAGDMSTARLRDLVAAGVDTFVCLQTSYTEYGCSDYPRQLRELGGAGATREIRFLHCPVPDFGVLSTESLHALVVELQRELASPEGHVLYVHCMGGHGRTGTVVVNLIMALDGVDFGTAMATLQRCHRGRGCGHCALNDAELEDDSQERQALAMQGAMGRQHKIRKN